MCNCQWHSWSEETGWPGTCLTGWSLPVGHQLERCCFPHTRHSPECFSSAPRLILTHLHELPVHGDEVLTQSQVSGELGFEFRKPNFNNLLHIAVRPAMCSKNLRRREMERKFRNHTHTQAHSPRGELGWAKEENLRGQPGSLREVH